MGSSLCHPQDGPRGVNNTMHIHFESCVLRITGRLSIARSYLQTLENSLPNAKRLAIQELKATAKAHYWDAEEYFEGIGNIDHEFGAIPDLAGSAFIAYLHGIVEHGLSIVCNTLNKKKKLPLLINDIAGSPIERAKTYLTKLAGIKVGRDPGWSALTDLAKLRHVILHAGGEVGEASNIEKEIARIQKRYPGMLSVEDRDLLGTREVCVSLPLCRQLLSEVEAFFDRLFKASGLEGVTVIDKGA